MAYSKTKLKISVNKAFCFRPFLIGNASDKCLPLQTLLYVLFRCILIGLMRFMDIPNSVRILYRTSLAFLKFVIANVLYHYTPVVSPVSDKCRMLG